MIRKTLLVTLSILAAFTGGLWAAGRWHTISWESGDDLIPTTWDTWDNCIFYTWNGGERWSISVSHNELSVRYGRRLFCGTGVDFTDDTTGFAGIKLQTTYIGKGRPERLCRIFTFPLWIPLVTFLAYPLAALLGLPRRRRRMRRLRGECVSCGYNLTGNVSGICPECGWRISAAKP